MVKKKHILVGLYIILLGFCLPISAQILSIQANIDKQKIKIGEQAILHLEIQSPTLEGLVIKLPQQKAETTLQPRSHKPEYIEFKSLDTIKAQNTYKIKASLSLTGWQNDTLNIAPIVVQLPNGQTDSTQAFSLEVIEPKVNIAKPDSINPITDIWHPTYSLAEVFYLIYSNTWFWLILVAIIIIISILIYEMRKAKKSEEIIETEIILTPYENAVQQLDQLNKKRYPDTGEFKLFYTEVTNILREFMEKEFRINAIEMTSSEILRWAKKTEEGFLQLKRIFDEASLVKFAKYSPTADDAVSTMEDSLQWLSKYELKEEDKDSRIETKQPLRSGSHDE